MWQLWQWSIPLVSSCFFRWPSLSINDCPCYHRTPCETCHSREIRILNHDILQGCSGLCNWLPLWYSVPWINKSLPAFYLHFSKSNNFKQPLCWYIYAYIKIARYISIPHSTCHIFTSQIVTYFAHVLMYSFFIGVIVTFSVWNG